MIRPAARFLFLLVNAALLAGFFVPPARADGPTLTAKFGIAGRYRPGGWCLVTVSVQNPGSETISGQIQVVAANQTAPSPYGRGGRQDTPTAVFACPVSVPGGSAAPHFYPLYLRGIDPAGADLTVRLAEGRERGDGRLLASISNQNQNTAQAFTGNPLSPNDSLLVGFGGDPGAFMFLSGRSLPSSAAPSMSQPNPNGLSPAAPATAQVAEAATAADLPDRAAGYDGVSAFLLRSDAPIEALTEAQTDALRGWVAGGGHLIVCGGPDATRFGSAFFTGLLPATVSAANASGALTLAPKPLPGVRVLQSAPGGPQIVSGPYGAGLVTLTAFDPTGQAFRTTTQTLPPVWQTLLLTGPSAASSVLGITAVREENYGAVYYGNSPPLLSEAVMRGPSLDAPGTSVIAVFLLVYLIVLVPVNYFVLKKYDRKELAWVTIPALVFLFAAGTFGVGYVAKGGSVFVNRAAFIETHAGQTQAGVYSEIGLFSPHRTTYDIALSGDNLVAAVPNPGMNYGSGSGDESQGSGPVQFVETPGGVTLPNTPVNMWAMRAFDAQSTTDLGGAIDGTLADNIASVKGTLVNHTPYALTNCAVLYAGNWHFIGTLASGATVALSASKPAVLQPMFPGNASSMDAQTGIRDRMQVALGDYFRSLSQSSPNYNGGASTLVYAPAPGEAILAGWSSDPKLAGPAPRIDGSPVTENDVSLVIVHLPVSGGAPQPVLPAVLPAGGIGLGGFGVVGRTTLSYRQALDTRTLSTAQASALVGHVVRLRGTVFVFAQTGGSTTLGFAPSATPSGIHVALPFSSWRNPARFLVGREVILTGTLTHSGSGLLLVVSRPSWVQVAQ